MPVIRNPFKKNVAAPVETKTADSPSADPTVPRSEVKTPAISILSHRDEETDSYKLCVVNGSGEYLPPSPPEKKGFWKRSNSSTSFRREVREALRAADNEEGFTISRESFEGYRRSFDISARSPVIGPQRPSLDSRTSRSSFDRFGGSRNSLDRPSGSRTSLEAVTGPISPLRQSFDSRGSSNNVRLPPAAVEETASDDEEGEFKDVDLNDNGSANNSNNHNSAHPKKKGFLARFHGGSDHHHHSSTPSVEHSNGDKTRSRSSTLTWKKDLHQGSEELGDFQPDTPNS